MDSKIKDTKLLSKEETAKEERRKQLAIIKASNELLADAKETVINTDKLDDLSKTKRVKEIEQAIEQNKSKYQFLNATKEEIEAIEYGEASEAAKEKYKRRMERRGLTEEDVMRKDIATVSATAAKETKTSKRTH